MVFVGGNANLGYLAADRGDGRTFVSLLDRLPADQKAVGAVRAIYVGATGVYFVCANHVLRWRAGSFTGWPFAGTDRVQSGWAGGHLYVQNPELGLLRLEGDAFAAASADPLFRRATVNALADNPDGTVLLGTAKDGLFTMRADGTATPAGIPLNDWLKARGIYRLLRLRDGSLAIATEDAGLVLLDAEGIFRTHVDRVGGLRGNNLTSLYEDAEDGLWIGLQTGVASVEVRSPFSILRAGPEDDLSNLATGDYCAGAMILGNGSGLFRLAPTDPATATPAHLEPLPGVVGTFTSTAAVPTGLLITSPGQVELLDAGMRRTPVLTTTARRLVLRLSRRHPGRVYVAEDNGRVGTLRFDGPAGRWVPDRTVAELGGTLLVGGLVEAAGDVLWVGSYDHGLYRVRPGADGSKAQVTSFFDAPGPLRGERFVYASSDGGPLVFMTRDRLYRPDESGEGVRPAAEYGTRFVDGSFVPRDTLSFEADGLWVLGRNTNDPGGEMIHARVAPARDGRPPVVRELPRKLDELIGQVQGFIPMENAPEPLQTLLILPSVGNGIVRLDVPRWKAGADPRPFATLLRRAVSIDGSAADLPAPMGVNALPYARNSAHFEYAAGTLALGAALRFQTRLAGFGEGRWSEWSERNGVDYTNLPEGGYTFEVRARNADGQLGSIASLPFRILPPWRRTAWAYALYTLAAACGIVALVWSRGRRLRRRNAELEAAIGARTGELVHARDQADAANRAKSAFLANMTHELRTPLNAILGYSQILLKDPDLSVRNRERITTVDRSSNHLLSMINEVLDLSKIEAGKLTLNPTPFSLEALLDDLNAAFR